MNAASLTSWTPEADLLITASFGYLIPTTVLDCFGPMHALNLHPSLLPKYRGAAPIQRALANGDTETGVTLQELSREKFDRGRILKQTTVPLSAEASYKQVESDLGSECGQMLVEVLKDFERYKNGAYPQEGQVTKASKATNEQSRIDWSSSDAKRLYNWDRGFGHQYPLWTTLNDRRLQLFGISYLDTPPNESSPGTCRLVNDHLEMLCGSGILCATHIKQQGSKVISAKEFWNGASKGKQYLQFD